MAKKQSSKSSRPSTQRSQRSTKAGGARASSADSSDELSFSSASDYVADKISMQTAGIALAGAGLLALVSSEAGRSLLRTASDAVVSFVSKNSGFMNPSDENADQAAEPAHGGRRSRADQARV